MIFWAQICKFWLLRPYLIILCFPKNIKKTKMKIIEECNWSHLRYFSSSWNLWLPDNVWPKNTNIKACQTYIKCRCFVTCGNSYSIIMTTTRIERSSNDAQAAAPFLYVIRKVENPFARIWPSFVNFFQRMKSKYWPFSGLFDETKALSYGQEGL